VQKSQGHRPPADAKLRSEPAIVAGMARATFDEPEGEGIDWQGLVDDYDRIRDAIEMCIPGFEAYNERVRVPGGFVLYNGTRDRKWNTSIKRARFTVHAIPRIDLAPDQYLMMTVRSHDQYNTTIYGLDDRYRGIFGERRVVMMDHDDIVRAGFVEGQLVELTSHWQGETRMAPGFIVVEQQLPTKCVATYFPEANVLVPVDHVADRSNTPASKSVVISITPARSAPE
jgi:anaerobic selenocysteine-containing dehydrogenase